jgi:acetolactate synthase-1/3 small subunit
MEPQHTLSVFTENRVGLLGRVTAVFTRRTINIESLTVSESEVVGVHRFTIVVRAPRAQAVKLAAQLERQVEVLKAFVHDDVEVVPRELCLFKLDVSRLGPSFEEDVVAMGARIVTRESAFVIVETTSSPSGTGALRARLARHGVVEFVSSGCVALTRPMKTLDAFLDEVEGARRSFG